MKTVKILFVGVLLQLPSVNCFYAQTANANIRLWLKADAGTNTTTNGAGITSWTDQGGAGNNPTVTIPGGATVTYSNTSTYAGATFFNYNPSIRFNGGYLLFPDAFASGMNGLAASIFYALSVVNTTPTTTNSTWGELHNFSAGSGTIYVPFPMNPSGTGYYYMDDFGATMSGVAPFATVNAYDRNNTSTTDLQYNLVTNMQLPVIYNAENNGAASSWTAKTFLNGSLRSNYSVTAAPAYKNGVAGNVTVFKGDGPSGGVPTIPLNCSASEVLLFTTNLPANEKSNVDSYLAIKNGVTLLQTVGTNYTASASTTIKWANDANVIWSAATNGTYKNNIIGIGKDNLTSPILHQRQSRSVNTASNGNAIAISTQTLAGMNAGNATNISVGNSYFMVADNGGSMAASNPTASQIPAGIVNRVTRQWRVQATNFTQDVTIAFDISQLSGSVNPADLRLLIDAVDNDGNFTNSTIFSGPGGIAPQQNATFPNLYEFRGITSAQLGATNFLFTLGTVAWTTPLPVTLSSFEAACDGGSVELNWSTESERNFDRFVVERSTDGVNFFEVVAVKGHGDADSPNFYHSTLTEVYGVNYYRLKQIDKSGGISFSELTTANCTQTEEITFYPNPVNTGGTVSWWANEPFKNDVKIEIIDLSGKHVVEETLEAGLIAGSLSTVLTVKGMYFIRLNVPGKQVQTVKLIVE